MSQSDPYRRLAGYYDRFVEPMQAGVRKVALEIVQPQPGWRVLDVGCGTGTGLLPYIDAGCDVTGVDVSAAMLGKATARLGEGADLHLITAGDALPAVDDQFDLTITTLVLHEIPAEERRAFLLEMARVTKPGGSMLVVDFRLGSLRGWRGPLLRATTATMERLSGHYSGYRSFKAGGGVPAVLDRAGLHAEREKIVAGGNMALYVVTAGPS
jgi:demethylmenaquinone methyltransferase/2-methoxy-6-polyprenyl-1,4-benzoquinol methylase